MRPEPKIHLSGFRPMTKHKFEKHMRPRIERYKYGITGLAFRDDLIAAVQESQQQQLASDGGFEAHPMGFKEIRP